MAAPIPTQLDSGVCLISGNAHPALAKDLAAALGVGLGAAEVGAFADGEIRVRIVSDVRDCDVIIVQPTSPPVNEHLMTLAFLIDAARAAGASRVTAVVPYFGYARQEQRGRTGEARSAQVAARLLGMVGLDHLISLDLHAPALESALPMPATLLRADELFLPLVKRWELKDPVIVSPDAGGLKRAQRYALELDAPLAVIAKVRPRADAATVLQVLGEVRGRSCLIVDDMASTGRTLAGAAEALKKHGAKEIHAAFTHPVMAPEALDRLFNAPLSRLLASDSVPRVRDRRIQIAPVAPLLASAVRQLGIVYGAELARFGRCW
jgi:ribose-phosphate pyrophosphokinase